MYSHSIIVHSRSETLETSRSFQTIYPFNVKFNRSHARRITIIFSRQYFYFKRIIRRSVMHKIMCRTRISSRAYYNFPILSGREEEHIRGAESVCAHAERVDGWARWNRREQIDGKGWKSAKRPREKDTKQLC